MRIAAVHLVSGDNPRLPILSYLNYKYLNWLLRASIMRRNKCFHIWNLCRKWVSCRWSHLQSSLCGGNSMRLLHPSEWIFSSFLVIGMMKLYLLI